MNARSVGSSGIRLGKAFARSANFLSSTVVVPMPVERLMIDSAGCVVVRTSLTFGLQAPASGLAEKSHAPAAEPAPQSASVEHEPVQEPIGREQVLRPWHWAFVVQAPFW